MDEGDVAGDSADAVLVTAPSIDDRGEHAGLRVEVMSGDDAGVDVLDFCEGSALGGVVVGGDLRHRIGRDEGGRHIEFVEGDDEAVERAAAT